MIYSFIQLSFFIYFWMSINSSVHVDWYIMIHVFIQHVCLIFTSSKAIQLHLFFIPVQHVQTTPRHVYKCTPRAVSSCVSHVSLYISVFCLESSNILYVDKALARRSAFWRLSKEFCMLLYSFIIQIIFVTPRWLICDEWLLRLCYPVHGYKLEWCYFSIKLSKKNSCYIATKTNPQNMPTTAGTWGGGGGGG